MTSDDEKKIIKSFPLGGTAAFPKISF